MCCQRIRCQASAPPAAVRAGCCVSHPYPTFGMWRALPLACPELAVHAPHRQKTLHRFDSKAV